MPGQEPKRPIFDGTKLDSTVIALPLIEEMRTARGPLPLIIDLNLLHGAGLLVAREVVHLEIVGYEAWRRSNPDRMALDFVDKAPEEAKRALTGCKGVTKKPLEEVVDLEKGRYTPQYVYPRLTSAQLKRLVDLDAAIRPNAIYKVWPDFEVETMLTKSVATVKGDAARIAFSAAGERIVWAVADTGIDGSHSHFEEYDNLDLSRLQPLRHMDFTGDRTRPVDEPEDPHGHGTHVAGIIAGESPIEKVPTANGAGPSWVPERWAGTVERDKEGEQSFTRWQIREPVSGVAPRCTLVSLRVLNESGTGRVSNLLAAIGYVQEVNDHGRWIRIHGINMSVGYGFDPEWFGCGQSPLCVEVDRLVQSGVSVVVAAGNTGYWNRGGTESVLNSGLDLTINDPGNAELAITVGATHREKPHVYGVSYFSSKGPTGDGRLKPDLVAPGEKVLSCAAGRSSSAIESRLNGDTVDYRQESGTSMAAPHVSGAIAAFLSIRREFIGHPQRVKQIFLESATDLGRERYFQGHGLVDLMRAIQSV